MGFLFFNAKIFFIQLKQIFIEVFIFCYFYTKCQIKIKTNTSRYVTYEILSYLTSNK